ncbi:hypothetical protein SAY86_006021 [Trapa natans]|uniref:Uncharacterized protein n=1 Tax=Trapa natans TaxID=22666 RepID=A0AAN7L8Y3_TRANT|nr:hypothetical protein SAY86_006021 [Trapa natans]
MVHEVVGDLLGEAGDLLVLRHWREIQRDPVAVDVSEDIVILVHYHNTKTIWILMSPILLMKNTYRSAVPSRNVTGHRMKQEDHMIAVSGETKRKGWSPESMHHI